MTKEVYVNEGGYLTFSSFKSFEKIVSDIESGEKLGISPRITLTRTTGINISSLGGISGFLPSESDISDLDMFGACYYNNQWRGIRFVK